MDIKYYLERGDLSGLVAWFKGKKGDLPKWADLQKEYDPRFHPINDTSLYRDKVSSEGVEKVTRIAYDLQRLACKRMTELMFGIPVKRVYKAKYEKEQVVADFIEKVLQRNRIDALNLERGNMLFASCEVLTLWFAIAEKNRMYGVDSPLKVKTKTFSSMEGYGIYPVFDGYGDYVAVGIEYFVKEDKEQVCYFDIYTSDRHLKLRRTNAWVLVEDDVIVLGKNPTLYLMRPSPIWEHTSPIVYEMEWAMSRNGNYLRKNSKPVFAVFADEEIGFGDEKSQDDEFKTILQYPSGSKAEYITWSQAIDNLKFFVTELRGSFFSQLQLPDWSHDTMKSTPMSGEARKQMFIDALLKVKEEQGRWLLFFDREVNVLRAFAKLVLGAGYEGACESLEIEHVITPFSINDEKEQIQNIIMATGGKAILSQREGIEYLGWSENPEETMKQIQEEEDNANKF